MTIVLLLLEFVTCKMSERNEDRTMNHTLYHGNCMDLMRDMKDSSVHLTLTDIPYSVVNRKSGGLRNLDKGKADDLTFDISEFLKEIYRVTSGTVYVFCGTEQVSQIRSELVSLGMTTRLGVWEKTNPSPMNGEYLWLSSIEVCVFGRKRGATFNEKCQSPVWRYPATKSKFHPTQKSLKLFTRLILASSNVGDTVFDPCMGSGTTGEASATTGRDFIGAELDDVFFSYSKNRIDIAYHCAESKLLV